MKLLNILIVEDDELVALSLRHTIKKHFPCKHVDMVLDGIEAWKKIRVNHYDLIISDWNMPHKTGAELLADVRTLERSKGTPFLMLTGRADRQSVATAVQSGANGSCQTF